MVTPARPTRPRPARVAVWSVRCLLIGPFVLMGPEICSLIAGRKNAVAHVSSSAADVLGTSSLLLFMGMLAITPLHTLAGWKSHLVLRRELGLAMFASATLDLVLAATTTGDTFKGGLVTRVAGRTFLIAGTLSTVLLVPLAATATLRAKRWLGPHWKTLHRITYLVWVGILIHLAFLFAFRRFFIDALVISTPLAVMRLPPVRTWWADNRRHRTHRPARWILGVAMVGIFVAGAYPFVIELAKVGYEAFTQNPPSD